MAPSTEHLSKYFRYKRIHVSVPNGISFNGPTCLAVICYVLKFQSSIMSDSISRANNLASKRRRSQDIAILFVRNFVPELQKFFNVPKADDLLLSSTKETSLVPKEKEMLVVFIDFLLQVLHCEVDDSSDHEKQTRYAILLKELTFLLCFLGDTPFDNLEEVKLDLFTEFQNVANEAGNLIYSRVFAVVPFSAASFDVLSRALLEKVAHLNTSVKEHCIRFSKVSGSCTTPGARDAVDSMFIVDSLLEDLQNVVNLKSSYLNTESMKSLIQSLDKVLTSMRAPLMNIETDTDEVKEFAIQIRDLAYEAEYLINSHVVGNVPDWYLNLRLPAVIQKIELVGTRLKEIKEAYYTKVLEVANKFSGEVSLQKTQPTVALDDLLIGFEENRTKLLGDLVGGPEELKIISIFGMPGLGKTTIANKLYNDESVIDHLDLRAWCVVSQEYQRKKVLLDILKGISRNQEEKKISMMEDDGLSLEIYQTLIGRRYFIVMDDVWYNSTWVELERYFPDDRNGSRIMLTSRIKDSAPANSIFHPIPLLSESQCWELLEKKVFHKEPCPPQLQDIGKRIARKCNGLPLAVVVTAGVLANPKNKGSDREEVERNLDLEEVERNLDWEGVERNLDSFILDDDLNKCMKILELSYEHLPNHLKLCFLYLGIYPEDTEIPTRKLKWLWIAEGFVRKENQQCPEHVAEQYLLELVNRSLLLIARTRSDGGIKSCRIHDLLRDMCLRKAHEKYFWKTINDCSSIYEKHHRLCVINSEASTYGGLHCRSFSGYFKNPSSCFAQMSLLRVIDLCLTDMDCGINRIYDVAHLRYLGGIDQVPRHIAGNFTSLEFLCLESHYGEENAVILPSAILKMVNLRHIQIISEAGFQGGEEWDLDQKRSNLKSLSYVCINNRRDEEILGCWPHLGKLKCICNGEVFPDLNSFSELESLNLMFECRFTGELAKVNFPSTIRKLTLTRVGLPWEKMSTIGKLPNLNVLKLLFDAFVGEEWETKDDEFRELKFLKLKDIKLNHWVISEKEHFPKLQFLVLNCCPGAQLEIPSEIGNITTLQRIEVWRCSNKINESAALIQQEQFEYGNEELEVIVSDVFKR